MDALIGYSGFVGGTLLEQHMFSALYRSSNISEIAGKRFDLVVCAGAPAMKWKANKDPEGDLLNLQRLMEQLKKTETKRFVLISTVDVYPRPVEVDEDSYIEPNLADAYGRNRYILESFVREIFENAVTIRLPGLFGRGLKKNFIFDLIGNPEALHLTHRDSRFQFYDMSRLWADIQLVIESGAPLMNFATEPVRAADVANFAFGFPFTQETEKPPVAYDMRTRFAHLLGGSNPYIASAEQTMRGIAAFVHQVKAP